MRTSLSKGALAARPPAPPVARRSEFGSARRRLLAPSALRVVGLAVVRDVSCLDLRARVPRSGRGLGGRWPAEAGTGMASGADPIHVQRQAWCFAGVFRNPCQRPRATCLAIGGDAGGVQPQSGGTHDRQEHPGRSGRCWWRASSAARWSGTTSSSTGRSRRWSSRSGPGHCAS